MTTTNETNSKMGKMKKIMTTYNACAIVEGFDGENHSPQEQLEAWAYLIKTGQCWSLQGWYGRNASALIEAGYIDKSGNIIKDFEE